MTDIAPFVHLKVHTEFSLVDGLVRLKPLLGRVAELNMPAVAVTDQTNFFGLVKFFKAASGAGVKPIYGSDFWIRDEKEGGNTFLISLYAQNEVGYQNLTRLISLAYQKGQHQGLPFVTREWIAAYSEGVLALSGAKFGDVGQALVAGKHELALERLRFWKGVFPNAYYLELQRTGRENDERHLHAAVELALLEACPVVATNDVRFLNESEFDAHEARVCIYEGKALDDPRRPRIYSPEQYLRTPEEMVELFSDLPEAIENTLEIAKRCTVTLKLGTYFLPEYPIPQGMDMNDFFRKVSHDGLDERLAFLFDTEAEDFPEKQKLYRDRLDFELDVIVQMGFPGYFLIVMDFIQWAKAHDIPVGPGRGSGAGSLVAYAQKITDLDPIEYDLLFERFLNPERVSMPDFDVDFCMDNRDQVINYVAENYGREAVSQIITYGTMAAKAVVRDVARVQGKSYGLADKLSKLIPFEVGMTLKKGIEQEPALKEFVETDEEAGEIWGMALQLEGVVRGVGKHAGGVVIAPTRITDFSAIYCDEAGDGVVTQFDKGDVEDAGLVKFDFLGLRTLTIIDWAKRMIDVKRAREGLEPLNIMAIPLEDPETFALLKRCETTAVFQLESRGMKDLIKRLQPDCFEDIIALVALFRPGPLQSGMVDNFINRKHGREELSFPDAQYQHEWLKPILQPTYGIILYQEQVMQIAQELAGYTLGGADMLRRAMGKKKPEEMAKQRSSFEDGAISKGVDGNLAMKIFDLVEKFAGYGFNKSHSAAYALVSYQTAWLKTHYPAEFMAGTMSSELDNTDKIVIFVEECRAMKMPPKQPDVNTGEYMFTVNEAGDIIYGLGAIKGLGEGPIESLMEARKSGGPFTDLFDFCKRVDLRKVNKRALEAMIRAGAFDIWGVERSILMACMPEAVKVAEQSASSASAGMADLFGEVVSAAGDDDVYAEYRHIKPWGTRERLNGEKETLGLYLTGHPIDDYESEIRHFSRTRIVDLKADKSYQVVSGLIVGLRTVNTKRGDTLAIVTLDDRSSRMEVAVFSELYNENRDKLIKDAIVCLEGEVRFDDFSGGLKMTVVTVMSIADARKRYAQGVTVDIVDSQIDEQFVRQFGELLEPRVEEGTRVTLNYCCPQAKASIKLGADWQVLPSDDLLQRLKDHYGEENVALNYAR
jgi:DNA polymerase-3 subunit alpha